MRRVGTLAFTLNRQPRSLGAFVEADEKDMQRLFVPFGDLTNGVETYQGGRYLDLDRTTTGLYDLDFNRAYHPFCLFNASYDLEQIGPADDYCRNLESRNATDPRAVRCRLYLQSAPGLERYDVARALTGVLFTFPSRYWFTIGRWRVFSLTRWSS